MNIFFDNFYFAILGKMLRLNECQRHRTLWHNDIGRTKSNVAEAFGCSEITFKNLRALFRQTNSVSDRPRNCMFDIWIWGYGYGVVILRTSDSSDDWSLIVSYCPLMALDATKNKFIQSIAQINCSHPPDRAISIYCRVGKVLAYPTWARDHVNN